LLLASWFCSLGLGLLVLGSWAWLLGLGVSILAAWSCPLGLGFLVLVNNPNNPNPFFFGHYTLYANGIYIAAYLSTITIHVII
jgi:hypothetical protein